jgi:hypothetical protein
VSTRQRDCGLEKLALAETLKLNRLFSSAVGLTSDVRGGLRLAASRPLDGDVRRATLSKETTGTRGHQRSDWAVRWRRGGTKAGGFWHFGSYNLNQSAAMIACLLTGAAKQANAGATEGFERVLIGPVDAGLFWGG